MVTAQAGTCPDTLTTSLAPADCRDVSGIGATVQPDPKMPLSASTLVRRNLSRVTHGRPASQVTCADTGTARPAEADGTGTWAITGGCPSALADVWTTAA